MHNITNHVVMNLTANALLALGASPIMAHAREEVSEMAQMAGALVLNIGTLSSPWVEAMELALAGAQAAGRPVVLDPVGAGATEFRTKTAHKLLESKGITVLRGNASEVLALTPQGGRTKGVDATEDAEGRSEVIRDFSEHQGLTVSVSGKVDHILGAGKHLCVHNGNEMMTRITGMGCTASAITGAFCAVNPDPAFAAAHAMVVLGVAAEMAALQRKGPASMQTALLDALYNLDGASLMDKGRITGA